MDGWLGRKDSNLRSPDPESGALPLGHSPVGYRRPRARVRGPSLPRVRTSLNRQPKETRDTLAVMTQGYVSGMDGKATRPDRFIRFRLTSARDARADIRLRRVGDRWIAVSDSRGREVTGIGSTARGAIVASIEWLGPSAVRGLLVDLRLLDVSVLLAESTAG